MTSSKSSHRTIVDAKAHLSECLREAESGAAVVLTRHGRPVAAIVSIELFAQLERLEAAGPEAGLYGIAGGWEGSSEVAQKAVEYGRSGPRNAPDFD